MPAASTPKKGPEGSESAIGVHSSPVLGSRGVHSFALQRLTESSSPSRHAPPAKPPAQERLDLAKHPASFVLGPPAIARTRTSLFWAKMLMADKGTPRSTCRWRTARACGPVAVCPTCSRRPSTSFWKASAMPCVQEAIRLCDSPLAPCTSDLAAGLTSASADVKISRCRHLPNFFWAPPGPWLHRSARSVGSARFCLPAPEEACKQPAQNQMAQVSLPGTGTAPLPWSSGRGPGRWSEERGHVSPFSLPFAVSNFSGLQVFK